MIVVTHKDYEMPTDERYLPIYVGVGIPKLKDKFQLDDAGENISEKSITYCELTAIYWAWKNLNLADLDYVGVAHYRRHFSMKKGAKKIEEAIRHEELDKIMRSLGDKAVIATPAKQYFTSVQKHYEGSLNGYEEIHKKDIKRLKEAIHVCSPNYDESASKVLNAHEANMLNMFIMSSKNFNPYCEWPFPIIDKVLALSGDREDLRRYAGALSEFCLDIWGKLYLYQRMTTPGDGETFFYQQDGSVYQEKSLSEKKTVILQEGRLLEQKCSCNRRCKVA